MSAPMTRHRWRTVLLWVGVLPALAALAFTAMVARVLIVQHSGDNAYGDGHYLDAAGHYRSAGHLNPFEDWVAAFDAGTARHTEGQYAAATKAYESALAFGVPHRDRCTVRIDLSLAWEAIGDRAGKKHRLQDAQHAYQLGISALEDGHCPTDSGRGAAQTKDAKTVDERLHRKLQDSKNQQKRQQQNKKKKKKNQKSQQNKKNSKNKSQQRKRQEQQRKQRQEQKQRERKLRQQNQQGLKDRKQQQNRDGGFGYEPSW